MQEASVGWDPNYVCFRDPGWAVRLYTFYLLFAFCYFLAKAISVARGYAAFRKAGVATSDASVARLEFHVRPVFRLSVLTSLAAASIFTIGVSNGFHAVAQSKAAGIGAMSSVLEEASTLASAGLVLALAMYFLASVLEGRIALRKIKMQTAD